MKNPEVIFSVINSRKFFIIGKPDMNSNINYFIA